MADTLDIKIPKDDTFKEGFQKIVNAISKLGEPDPWDIMKGMPNFLGIIQGYNKKIHDELLKKYSSAFHPEYLYVVTDENDSITLPEDSDSQKNVYLYSDNLVPDFSNVHVWDKKKDIECGREYKIRWILHFVENTGTNWYTGDDTIGLVRCKSDDHRLSYKNLDFVIYDGSQGAAVILDQHNDISSNSLRALICNDPMKMTNLFTVNCSNLQLLYIPKVSEINGYFSSGGSDVKLYRSHIKKLEFFSLQTINNVRFSSFPELEYLNIPNLTTIGNWGYDFIENCSRLKKFTVPNTLTAISTVNSKALSVKNCFSLTEFNIPSGYILSGFNFTGTPLTHDCLINLFNNLGSLESTKTITLGTELLAKLTDEEKAIATGKGWTLA